MHVHLLKVIVISQPANMGQVENIISNSALWLLVPPTGKPILDSHQYTYLVHTVEEL